MIFLINWEYFNAIGCFISGVEGGAGGETLLKNIRSIFWQRFICLELTANSPFYIRDKVLNNNLLINVHII